MLWNKFYLPLELKKKLIFVQKYNQLTYIVTQEALKSSILNQIP